MSLFVLFFYVLVFALVGLLSYWALSRLMPNAMTQRMASLKAPVGRSQGGAGQRSSPLWQAWQQKVQRLLDWLSTWSMGGEAEDPNAPSQLRLRFFNAGVHARSAPAVYLAGKTVLTFVLPGLAALFFWQSHSSPPPMLQMAVLMLCAALGYYLPNALLAHAVRRYQRALFNSFPDALDLMRVCVQAGLGLDAAIDRVGREMRLSCPELSNEFALTGLELRAGASRTEALRHLSLRMGLEDLDALVVMLVQADRLGTSVTESLQIHSDALRTKRRLLAEETAAKLPVKLLIPLVFCVFPALLTVLLGPAVLSVHEILRPTAQSS
jgi:tight adherence protein C